MTSSASLFVASQLRYKIKSTIKEGAAILMPLDLLFGGAAAASPKSETKWPAPETAAAKKNPVAASQTSIAAGEKIYTKHCAACHGKNGDGDGPGIEELGIPPTKLALLDNYERESRCRNRPL